MDISRTDASKLLTIGQIPLFSDLRQSEKRLIAKKVRFQEYRKGDIIYKRGDLPDAFYCIVSGRVEIFNEQPDGKAEILEFLRSGSYFGIISLLTGEPHSVSVRVVNDSVVLKIEKKEFEVLLKYIPKLAIHLSQTLSRRLKRKDARPKTIFESTILTVYSVTKGIGRTKYTINLAVSIAQNTKKKIILLDMSRSGTEIARLLKFDEAKIQTLDLTGTNSFEEQIKNKVLNNFGVDILGVPIFFSGEDTTKISPLLTFLTNSYHYIIVDLPFESNESLFKVLVQSDLIHILTDCREEALCLIQQFLDRFKKFVVEDLTKKVKIIVTGDEPIREQVKEPLQNIFVPEPKVLELLINLKGVPIVLSNPDSSYAKAVRRIARTEAGVLVGLALGSGAALGFSHIGVLKILEREGIKIDAISGSSMGAVIAGLWASGINTERLEKIALKFKNIFTIINLLDITIPLTGLILGKKTKQFLEHFLGDKKIEDLNIPLKIISYDLTNRQPLVVEKGRVVDAIMKSISVPGIFRPIIENDIVAVDGGICEPVPVGPLINVGIKKIIAVNVLPGPEDILERQKILKSRNEKEKEILLKGRFFERLLIRIKGFFKKRLLPNIYDVIMSSMQAMEYVMAEESCKKADVAIHPVLPEIASIEFYNSEKLIKKGEEETIKLLPELQALLSE